MTSKYISGTIFVTIANFVFVFTGYLTNIYLGRHLGPAMYGKYSFIITIFSLIGIFQLNGIPQSLAKHISASRDPDTIRAIFRKSLFYQLALTGLITILYLLFARYFLIGIINDPKLDSVILFSAINFPLTGIMAIWLAYQNGLHQFGRQALISISYYLAKLIFIITFSIKFFVEGAIAGYVVATIIPVIVGFTVPGKTNLRYSGKLLLVFAGPVLLFSLLSNLQLSIDFYLIKVITGSDQNLGLYSAAQSIARLLIYALGAFSVIIFPVISGQLNSDSPENIVNMIRRTLRIVILILLPLTVIISATGKPLINLFYSSAYTAATPSLSILIFGMAFLTVFTLFTSIINGVGKPILSLAISLGSIIITTVACLLLIPVSGLAGAALATSIGAFISMVFAAGIIYRRFPKSIDFSSLFKITAAATLVYLLAKIANISNSLYLPLLYTVLLAVYALLLIILQEITRTDWLEFRSVLPRKWLLAFSKNR
jgi:stage V sporulation protein B